MNLFRPSKRQPSCTPPTHVGKQTRQYVLHMVRVTAIPGAAIALVIVLAVSLRSATAIAQTTTPQAATTTSTAAPGPTPDATVTALQKEKLAQEVTQLQGQNDQSILSLLRRNISSVISSLLTAAVALTVGLFGVYRWFGDRRDAREKRAEEQFQKVVEWLGSGNEATQAGAAVTLRTFLQPGYERFYDQVFNLAVANLRLQSIDTTSPLSQALAIVFRESFVRTRDQAASLSRDQAHRVDALNAAEVRLPQAYLVNVDLEGAWMLKAQLNGANLEKANLSGANLEQAQLNGANLEKAQLNGANLSGADLSGANLSGAILSGAILSGAILSGAILEQAIL